MSKIISFRSSTGQSDGLRSRRLQVRILPGTPIAGIAQRQSKWFPTTRSRFRNSLSAPFRRSPRTARAALSRPGPASVANGPTLLHGRQVVRQEALILSFAGSNPARASSSNTSVRTGDKPTWKCWCKSEPGSLCGKPRPATGIKAGTTGRGRDA